MAVFGRLGHRLVGTDVMSLARLKWFAVVLPFAALVALVALLRSSLHEWLHESPGVFALAFALAVCVFAFASIIFALIEDLEARLLDQNRELSELLARTDQQNAELSALLTVGRASASSVELSAMLDHALDAIVAVTPAEAAELWLVEGGALTLERFRGIGGEALTSVPRLAVGEGLPGAAASTKSTIVERDRSADARFERDEVTALGLETFCAVPLVRPTGTIGVLAVAARGASAFDGPGERRLLEGIAERVALAIENVHLYRQVLDRAVLEERERIARELHDGLAQVLGYINTQTQAVRKLLELGQTAEAASELEDMGAVSREVYADVREAIVGLRAAPAGLVPALREYLGRLPRMAGCEIELRTADVHEPLALAPAAEIQLLRIVQEALSNVRKHAGASHVEVVVAVKGDSIGVEIRDDGRGFDPLLLDRTGWPRLGLQTMRERAQAIGGSFDLVSVPGRGTRVAVYVPVPAGMEAARAGASR